MGEAIAFYTIAAFVLGFAVLVVSTKDTVHSVLFLVLDFLFVAALYVLLGAQFLAAIQVLVYAGGIVVLYLFVVMLVNLKRPPEVHQDPNRRGKLGFNAPLGVWLRRDLERIVGEWLAPELVRRRGLLDPGEVARLVEEHRSGQRDHGPKLWALIMVEAWARSRLD